jgi:hypothetical protein
MKKKFILSLQMKSFLNMFNYQKEKINCDLELFILNGHVLCLLTETGFFAK